MLTYSVQKVSFWSLLKKNFQNAEGENVEYYEVVGFSVDENGNVSDEPVTFGVKKDAVPLISQLNRGEFVTLRLEAFVKKARVCDVKKN